MYLDNHIEEIRLAERAVHHLTSIKDFTKYYQGLTGRRSIDPLYPKTSIAIISDLIICLQSIYKDENISLRILFQELFKIADLMEKKNLSGNVVWNELIDSDNPTIYSKYATGKSIDDTFNFIIAALYVNELTGNILEDCAFQSKFAYKFKAYEYNNEKRLESFTKPSASIVNDELKLQLELDLLQKKVSDIVAEAFELGWKYRERCNEEA